MNSAPPRRAPSNPWMEGRHRHPTLGWNRRRRGARDCRGAALIVTMWVLLILGLLVASFSFDMRVEAEITSHLRKRTRAADLAKAGIEWAKLVIEYRREADPGAEADSDADPVYLGAVRLQRGIGVQQARVELDTGYFTVDIVPEEQRRNVNRLSEEEWEEILDQAQVPQERWYEIIDCFIDWTDANDTHGVNGAEADDPFYKERGYEPKNGPVDSLDELLLIKGFDERILYGGPPEEEDGLPCLGIARWITTWGDGKVNINTASREVLLSIPELTEQEADDIIAGRVGLDGQAGTRDDGYESVDEMLQITGVNATLKDRFSAKDFRYLKIVSTGESDGVKYTIWCTMLVQGKQMVPVAWREEPAY